MLKFTKILPNLSEIGSISINCNRLLEKILVVISLTLIFTQVSSKKNLNSFDDNVRTMQEDNQIVDRNLFTYQIDCYRLKVGQFRCDPYILDRDTQQPSGCTKNNFAPVNCTLRPGLFCDESSRNLTIDGHQNRIRLMIPCQYTNNYSYEITLLLSIFLGMFGVDRFYLGYPAIGLLKFCTLGFLFLGQFIDIILIAMQVVKPADGSNYVIKFFGPRLTIVHSWAQKRIPMLFQNDSYSLVAHSEFDLYFYPSISDGEMLASIKTILPTQTS
ncbi:TM2 domain-containing protein-like protein [Sarcoptes scabiei]|uniref:TM2 domain-containing protein-like protein n=1 Tax=Sarcoptes scabiei TaxID=52283 RepID=A0A132A4R5_SARSC|nr:TM2 domain-containing protein-like protein [Sarcoptes scabiei]